MKPDYYHWISERLRIVNKNKIVVDFIPNKAQADFLANMTGRDIILKARQLGFSSLILAVFTFDFILIENTYNLVIADIDENAEGLLDRVKFFLQSYEERAEKKVPLKYNSRHELYNPVMNSYFKIGSAKNIQIGRSRTTTNLHLSELSFFPNPNAIFASALQSLVPGGRAIIETTANGFNDFKALWDEAEERGFKKHFYNAKWEYDDAFLEQKKKELKELFPQEYPMTDQEAFLTSGELYFDKKALADYLAEVREPLVEDFQFGGI